MCPTSATIGPKLLQDSLSIGNTGSCLRTSGNRASYCISRQVGISSFTAYNYYNLVESGNCSKTPTMNQEIDYQLSQQAAELIQAKSKECWRNAILAQQHYPDAIYVEGCIVWNGLVIEHGWLELENRIVEPTLASRLNMDLEPPQYFAGVRYTVEEALNALGEVNGELPLICRDGHWGRETPSYMLAYCDAWDHSIIQSGNEKTEGILQDIHRLCDVYPQRIDNSESL